MQSRKSRRTDNFTKKIVFNKVQSGIFLFYFKSILSKNTKRNKNKAKKENEFPKGENM